MNIMGRKKRVLPEVYNGMKWTTTL